ncbi:glycoside hydrolase family 13 protein [Aquipuribacter nitratireducens]|uniref:Glycoside hydrolase family 13 protein n=1 Tax=Aquipuribacter nitratireducens TaxID=650104 RepID=A0ABW0GLQ7_9MICO
MTSSSLESAPWWRDAVIYQVYPRSFADGDGDGIGDLPGITSRLPKLAELGVDAVWLSPFYPSPQNDAGYDVSDYRDVEPIFGTLADADTMIATAHDLGLRVVVDVVPNHTSSEHAWFRAALAAAPGSPERARFHFRDGRGEAGELPPNNWASVFGGRAWTRVTEADGSPGQWYLHLFDSTQPDLNWDNPEVHDEFEDTLRFWLDRGVDGFRIDVAHAMVKAPGLPDWSADDRPMQGTAEITDDRRPPMWDQEGVHAIYRRWRAVTDSYDGDRMLVAEAWVTPYERLARYTRPDELHQAFNFDHCVAPWLPKEQQEVITTSLAGSEAVGAPTTWVLSNHDVVRHASRLGFPPATRGLGGIGPRDEQPDAELGLRRARAATLLMLSLPGSAYLWQGEELGLPEHTTLPDDVRQDPAWHRTSGEQVGRDGCRVPIPWEADAPSYGFGPGDASWLPQPPVWAELARDRQEGVDGSTLETYRAALRLRREHGLGRGSLRWLDERCGDGSLGLRNGDVTVLVTFDGEPQELPAGAEVLLTSGPLDADGRVPSDTTVWLRTP